MGIILFAKPNSIPYYYIETSIFKKPHYHNEQTTFFNIMIDCYCLMFSKATNLCQVLATNVGNKMLDNHFNKLY